MSNVIEFKQKRSPVYTKKEPMDLDWCPDKDINQTVHIVLLVIAFIVSFGIGMCIANSIYGG